MPMIKKQKQEEILEAHFARERSTTIQFVSNKLREDLELAAPRERHLFFFQEQLHNHPRTDPNTVSDAACHILDNHLKPAFEYCICRSHIYRVYQNKAHSWAKCKRSRNDRVEAKEPGCQQHPDCKTVVEISSDHQQCWRCVSKSQVADFVQQSQTRVSDLRTRESTAIAPVATRKAYQTIVDSSRILL